MKFSLKAARKFERDGGFDYLYEKSILEPVYYMIDWRYRKSKYLVKWIRDQVKNPSPVLKEISSRIKDSDNPDIQIKYIQKYVIKNMRYIGDYTKWKVQEYWQEANQTVRDFEGDCEDGCTLIYVLARLKGIPANRLMFMAGLVKSGKGAAQGGHAWLAYRPFRYPLNWVFIDWCYVPDRSSVENSNKYLICSKFIKPENNEEPYNYYKYIWFVFNEDVSFRELRTKK